MDLDVGIYRYCRYSNHTHTQRRPCSALLVLIVPVPIKSIGTRSIIEY
jgi:hypothetical protein